MWNTIPTDAPISPPKRRHIEFTKIRAGLKRNCIRIALQTVLYLEPAILFPLDILLLVDTFSSSIEFIINFKNSSWPPANSTITAKNESNEYASTKLIGKSIIIYNDGEFIDTNANRDKAGRNRPERIFKIDIRKKFIFNFSNRAKISKKYTATIPIINPNAINCVDKLSGLLIMARIFKIFLVVATKNVSSKSTGNIHIYYSILCILTSP